MTGIKRIAKSPKFTVLDMELLVPEMGFLLIQIETDTDIQGAVSELVFLHILPLLFASSFIALV